MPNPENIKAHEFKKGQSGNPKGRPKELKGIKDLIAQMGEDNIEAIVERLNQLALKGNLKAIQEILDRYYGKPVQYQDINSNVTQTNIISLGKGKKPE